MSKKVSSIDEKLKEAHKNLSTEERAKLAARRASERFKGMKDPETTDGILVGKVDEDGKIDIDEDTDE